MVWSAGVLAERPPARRGSSDDGAGTSKPTALVVGSRPLEEPGGIERFCGTLVRMLGTQGFTAAYLSASELVEGPRADRLPWRRYWSGASEAIAAALALRRRPEDLVITNGPIGGWVRDGTRESIHVYHGTYVGQAHAVRHLIRPRGAWKMRNFDGMVLERLAGRHKVCVANSRRTADEVARFYGYECSVVWCPVDTEEFHPGPRDEGLRRRLGIPDDRLTGLFVGSGEFRKGDRVAHQVMQRVPELTWVAIGQHHRSDPQATELQHHPLPTSEMPQLLRSVDLVLVPSLYESFGMIVAEALASGTPVVGGPTGAADLLMGDPSLQRFLVPDPRDASGFTEAVEGAVRDLSGARRAALRARKVVLANLAPETWGRCFLETVGLAS